MRGPHPNNETGHIGWRLLPFNGACFSLFGCFPSSGPGCARSTFPVGEGFLRRGSIHRGLALTFRGPLHTRRCGGTLSKQERAGAPHPARATPGPPSPWGKVPPQRRKRGGTKSVLRPAPHPSGLRPATLSQERVFPSSVTPYGVPPSPCGKASSGGCVPYLPFGFSNNFSVYPFTNPLLCCKIGSSSQKLWEVWS